MTRMRCALVLLVCGCGSARVVSQTGNTGVIELSGAHHKAMSAATQRMIDVCGDGQATIIKQGDEPTGDGADVAWRIHFQCGATRPTEAAPAPVPAAAPKTE